MWKSFVSHSLTTGEVCDEWVDELWDVIILGETDRAATRQDFERFFTLMDWNGEYSQIDIFVLHV